MAKNLVSRETNVPDAVIQKHVRLLTGLKLSADSAHAEYRAGLKAAKSDGINTGQIIAAMGAKKRELEDVVADMKNYVRYLSLVNMPVTQTDLFGSSTNQPDDSDDEGEDGELTEHLRWETEQVGFKAGSDGHLKESNPHFAGSARNQAWHEGWMRGQKQNAMGEKASPGVKKASTRRARTPALPLSH
jgi:ribosome modulation factor